MSRPHYSDLEVIPAPSEGPYVYESSATREANLPQAISPILPEVHKEATERIGGHNSTIDKRKGGLFGIFPLRRASYLAIALVFLVVVGVILGAVLGTKLNRPSQDSDQSGPSSTSSTKQILGNSTLTATNLTDSNGRLHRLVFFQDSNNAIIVRRWDSQNRTWESRNLTESVLLNSATPDVETYPGTPLASASLVFSAEDLYESWVWYIDTDNQIKNVGSVDLLYSEDQIRVNSLPERFVAGSGSRLATAWQRCPEDCMGSWIVAYQADDGRVNIVNGSGSWHLSDSFERAIAMGSSLSMVPQLNGPSVTGLVVTLENLLSSSTGEMVRMEYGTSSTDNQSWVDSTCSECISGTGPD